MNKVYFFSLFTLLTALIIFLLSVNVNYYNTNLLDFPPSPDAIEYMALSKNIYEKNFFGIQIAELQLPSRYPVGFSYVATLFHFVLKSFNQSQVLTLFYLNIFLGFATILITYLFYIRQKLWILLSIPLFLIITWPSFILLSRSSLSEPLGAFVILLACYLLILGSTKKNVNFYSGALLLGLSTFIKLQFVPLFIIILLYYVSKQIRTKELLLSCLFYAIGLAPLLVYQLKTFNSFVFNGYDFWVPGSVSFDVMWFVNNISVWFGEIILNEQRYSVSNIFGQGVYYRPSLIILLPIITFYLLKISFVRPLVVGILINLLLLAFYKFAWDLRLVYHLMLPIIALAGVAHTYIKNKKMKILFLGLFILSLLGIPDYTFIQKDMHPIGSLNHMEYHKSKSMNFKLTKFFKRKVPRYDLVLSPIDPVYLKIFLSDSAVVVPYNQDHRYKHSKYFQFVDLDTVKYVKKFLNKEVFYISNNFIDKQVRVNKDLEQFLISNRCSFDSIEKHNFFEIKKLVCFSN